MQTRQAMVRRGRGRPRDAEKGAMIRDATWRVLAERGYEGLTFEAVAESAGCTRATLYRRFPSKVALIAAILDGTARSSEPRLPPDISPREALVAHASSLATYLSDVRGRAIMSLGASARCAPELTAALGEHYAHEREYYQREFRRLHPAAAPEDVEFASHTLIGGVTYHVAMLHMPLSPARIRQLVDQAIALLAAGGPAEP